NSLHFYFRFFSFLSFHRGWRSSSYPGVGIFSGVLGRVEAAPAGGPPMSGLRGPRRRGGATRPPRRRWRGVRCSWAMDGLRGRDKMNSSPPRASPPAAPDRLTECAMPPERNIPRGFVVALRDAGIDLASAARAAGIAPGRID